jgi:hypothetical protein
MRRTLIAPLLAALALLALPAITFANPPKQCFSPFGFGGFCPGIFSKLHQHGPLFNYGPYYGYPPFEPYGNWNAYLQYTGPIGQPSSGGHGHYHGGHGDMAGAGGIWSGGGHGWHSSWSGGGWFHGSGCATCGHTSLFHHGSKGGSGGGCVGCQAFNPATIDALSGYTGAGVASYYAGLPALQPPTVVTASGFGR